VVIVVVVVVVANVVYNNIDKILVVKASLSQISVLFSSRVKIGAVTSWRHTTSALLDEITEIRPFVRASSCFSNSVLTKNLSNRTLHENIYVDHQLLNQVIV